MLKWQGMLLSDHNERISLDNYYEENYLNIVDEYEYKDWESWEIILKSSREEGIKIEVTYFEEVIKIKKIIGIVRELGKLTMVIKDEDGINRRISYKYISNVKIFT